MNNKGQKRLAVYNERSFFPLSEEDLKFHITRYTKALKDGRAICIYNNLQKMQAFKMIEMKKVGKEHAILEFGQLFSFLGFIPRLNNNGYYHFDCEGSRVSHYINHKALTVLNNFGLITTKTLKTLTEKPPKEV